MNPVRAAVALFAIAGITLLVQVGSSGAGTGSGPCFPREGSRTLLQNDVARVYGARFKTAGQGGRPVGPIYACVFAQDEPIALDTPPESIYAFLPPAMSLSGTVLGYAEQICPMEFDSCIAAVDVIDLTTERQVKLIRDRVFKVGSLQVKRDGAVAWIACPEHDRDVPVSLRGKRSPNCVRPGDWASVYKVDAAARHPRLLDRSRQIDPSSLRRDGSTITWLRDGKRRQATLK